MYNISEYFMYNFSGRVRRSAIFLTDRAGPGGGGLRTGRWRFADRTADRGPTKTMKKKIPIKNLFVIIFNR